MAPLINKTHGGARTKEYRAWSAAKNRCTNPNNNRYSTYGARGIRMSESWSDSFEAFLADMGFCPEGFEIDRIDNDGPYTGPCAEYPQGNCRWVQSERQANNKSSSRRVASFDGSETTVADVCRYMGVSPHHVYKRLDLGWSLGRAIAAPVGTARSAAA